MDQASQECPVCTLYLRHGMTLKEHLETHPKDQVIEALLKLKESTTVKNSHLPLPSTESATATAPHLTTALTYQQILTTTSTGAVVPQFFQVPTLVNSYPISQNMGFGPTLFNPLYNPYVPHQYNPFNKEDKTQKPTNESSESPLVSPEADSEPSELSESDQGSVEMDLGSMGSSRQVSPEPSPPSVIIARSTPSQPPPSKPTRPKQRPPQAHSSVPTYQLSQFSGISHETQLICKLEDKSVIVEVVTKTDELKTRDTCKQESSKVDEKLIILESDENPSFPNNPCPNLPFDHEIVANLPSLSKLSFEPVEPATSLLPDEYSEGLLKPLCQEEVSDCDIDTFETKPNDSICFNYVDEAANFTAPGRSNPVYDLIPSSSPRLLQDLVPANNPKLLNDLLPKPSSSDDFMEVDGLRIFFNSSNPVATASRVASPPSVIQMADSTKKEYLAPLNIAADESMPARGELSEQESLGADSAWGMFQSDMKIEQIWTNHGTKPLKCPLCSMTFDCPKERRAHKLYVHFKNGRVFKCTVCSQVFNNLRNRRAHMAVHSDVKPVKLEAGATAGVAQGPEVTSTVRHCPACGVTLSSMKHLRIHLREVHGEVRFKCGECNECFDEEADYNTHLKIHPLKCPQCSKCFFRRTNLNIHLKRHLVNKPFECPLCPKSFITRQKLEEHTNSHTGVRPLKCAQCDKTFNRHSNLIQHRNAYHGIRKKTRDFVCRCGAVFHSQRKLEWHRETHDMKPKSCPYCSQKFIHVASVTRHVRRSHMPGYLPDESRNQDENVSCPICDRVYLRSSLAVHMRVHNGIRNFQCPICSKTFTTKWNMELHMWTHQSRSAMPFKCNLCKSAFFREADHIAHLNAHKNLKPFICNVCGQKFIRKYNCIRHQEEHQRAKKFACTVEGCNRTFHRSYYLKDHMKVHTGARPHTCHMCGKSSSTKSNHNKHLRIHDIREMVNTEN